MKEIGEIVKIQDNLMEVELQKNVACGYCQACNIDKQKNSGNLFLAYYPKAKIGDRVLINVANSKIALSAFLLYILPLFLFVLAYLIGDYLGHIFFVAKAIHIVVATLMSTISLAVYYWCLRLRNYQYRKGIDHKPRVIKILA